LFKIKVVKMSASCIRLSLFCSFILILISTNIAFACSCSRPSPDYSFINIVSDLEDAFFKEKGRIFWGRLKSINNRFKSTTEICIYKIEVIENLKSEEMSNQILVEETLRNRDTSTCFSQSEYPKDFTICSCGDPIYPKQSKALTPDLIGKTVLFVQMRGYLPFFNYFLNNNFLNRSDEIGLDVKNSYLRKFATVIENISNPPSIEESNCFRGDKKLPDEYLYFNIVSGSYKNDYSYINKDWNQDIPFINLNPIDWRIEKTFSPKIEDSVEFLSRKFRRRISKQEIYRIFNIIILEPYIYNDGLNIFEIFLKGVNNFLSSSTCDQFVRDRRLSINKTGKRLGFEIIW